MEKTFVAAIDLGATSGRVIVGAFSKQSGLELNEVYRFPNGFSNLSGFSYWDIGGLFDHIKAGLLKATQLYPRLASCGVDTWGVDYAMLDAGNRLVFPVHAYRDVRTEPLLAGILEAGDDRKIYEWTGIPGINYNTILQLSESVKAVPSLKDSVARILNLPDYFNFLLSGEMRNEVSILSTGQLLDIGSMEYSTENFDYHGVPLNWFKPAAKAGERLGAIKDVDGLDGVEVILVPGHDTSAAFEAIPPVGNDLLVSSGTWMLVGALTEKPIAGEAGYALGVSNERAGDGSYRPNKINMGLWLLEQILPAFKERPSDDAGWLSLIEAAEAEPPPAVRIDIRDRALFNPADMKVAINDNVRAQGGEPPASLAGYVRLICDSLGAGVADVAAKFADILGTDFDNIVIVGGGSKNRLLSQRIADFAGLPVTSYALEATSVGNMAYQLRALGAVDSLAEFHSILARGLQATVYKPR